MNKNTYIAVITWIGDLGIKRAIFSYGYKKYGPQIAIDGNLRFCGSAWSLLCSSFEFLDFNKTKAYIRFLNIQDAPDVLFPGKTFELYECDKKIAYGEVIEKSECEFFYSETLR